MMALPSSTVSASVRRLLAGNGNQPLRLAVVFERLKSVHPTLTRTHFREKIVRQMVLRDEVSTRKLPRFAMYGR